jgi:hypothetical protein
MKTNTTATQVYVVCQNNTLTQEYYQDLQSIIRSEKYELSIHSLYKIDFKTTFYQNKQLTIYMITVLKIKKPS